MSDSDARYAIKLGLRRAIAAQRQGRLHEIDKGWDAAASFEHDDANLSLTLCFWEAWADSAAHEWLYYGTLRADDWPRMAADILTALDAKLPVSNAEVLEHFAARRVLRVPWLGRMRWFPHRHRMLAVLLAAPIVALLLGVVFFGTAMVTARASASHKLIAGLIGLFVLPPFAVSLLGPIARWLERRLIRSASRARDGEPPGV